jgi:uncharacterized FAD-dependent dehydrogenase
MGDLAFESYPLIHVGSDGVRAFGQAYAAHLRQAGVGIRLGQQATTLLTDYGRAVGAVVRDRRSRSEYRILADHVVVACGLALEPFISRFYDFKISHQAAGISLRSFCVNGNGHVTAEYHRSLGIRGVNGHSYLSASSGQSNLAIVATITEDHHRRRSRRPQGLRPRDRAIVNAAAGGYPIRQELRDLLPGTLRPAGVRASNPKTRPGRLQDVLPGDLLEAFTSYSPWSCSAPEPGRAVQRSRYVAYLTYVGSSGLNKGGTPPR